MAADGRSIDWRVPAVWAVAARRLDGGAHAYVEIADAGAARHRHGRRPRARRSRCRAISSWRRCCRRSTGCTGAGRSAQARATSRSMSLAVVPFSVVHTLGMAALRLLWFNGIVGEAYSFPLTVDRLVYEFAKDVITYAHAERRRRWRCATCFARAPAPAPSRAAPCRRRRGRDRCRSASPSASAARRSWSRWPTSTGSRPPATTPCCMSAARRCEIRSSLTRLESELDPKRFVRVHKSHLVNIARVVEVTPWVSGDWRIRLQDGAEVNLSRRYRQRFEALVPVDGADRTSPDLRPPVVPPARRRSSQNAAGVNGFRADQGRGVRKALPRGVVMTPSPAAPISTGCASSPSAC